MGEIKTLENETRKGWEISEDDLLAAMAASAYELTATAKRLNVSRTALYRRIDVSPNLRIAAQVPDQELEAALAESDGDLTVAALSLRVSASGLRARIRNSPSGLK